MTREIRVLAVGPEFRGPGCNPSEARPRRAGNVSSTSLPRCALWLFVLGAALSPSLAGATEEGRPLLALDAGGHTDRVNKVLFTPDGRQLITVSADKTIRVWSIHTGEVARVLRPPVGPGAEGTLFAAALTPDGETLAVAGYPVGAGRDGHPIYLLSLSESRIVGVLRGHDNIVHALAFSPDGRRLASGSSDHTVRLWNVANRQSEGVLTGHQEAVYGLAFSPDGARLASASHDGTARLWLLAETRMECALKGHAGPVHCVAWSPNGQTVATGSFDQSVRLWNANGTGQQQFDRLEKQITSVSFTPDGRRLLFTRGLGGPDLAVCSVIDLTTGKVQAHFDRHNNAVQSGALSPDGSLAATTGGNAYETYLWQTADGTIVQRFAGKGQRTFAAAWGTDGKSVAWGCSAQGDPGRPETVPLERTFHLGDLGFARTPDQTFQRARLREGAVSVEKTGRTTVTVKDGTRVTELNLGQANDRVLCFSRWGEHWVAVGSEFGLSLFDAKDGTLARTFRGHTGPVWAVAPAPDGRYLLSASSDQTLRIWRPEQDDALLALFVAGNDWIAWTPAGYYAASPGGELLMGWHASNGPDRLANYYPAAQFRKILCRPDVVKALLDAGSVEKALTSTGRKGDLRSQLIDVGKVLPPKAHILSPRTGANFKTMQIDVQTVAQSSGAHPVTSLRLLLDGRPYGGDQNVRTIRVPRLGEVRESWLVELPPGVHQLAVLASSAVSQGKSEEVSVTYTPSGDKVDPQGTLYLLAIGINAYPGDNRLYCAVPDARSINQLFAQQQGRGLYRQVQTKLLTDQQATRQGILEGLRWLQQSTPGKDLAVFFFAGHGTKDRKTGKFYFVPVDVNLANLAQTAVSEDEFKTAVANIRGRVLLLLDACHSGTLGLQGFKLNKQALSDLQGDLNTDDYGVVSLAAARTSQKAEEEKGHGYFTAALLEGLSGKADPYKTGLVRLRMLEGYVSERVRQLNAEGQDVVGATSGSISNFPVAKP